MASNRDLLKDIKTVEESNIEYSYKTGAMYCRICKEKEYPALIGTGPIDKLASLKAIVVFARKHKKCGGKKNVSKTANKAK